MRATEASATDLWRDRPHSYLGKRPADLAPSERSGFRPNPSRSDHADGFRAVAVVDRAETVIPVTPDVVSCFGMFFFVVTSE